MSRQRLFGKTLDELSDITAAASLPTYAARQIAGWLYRREAPEISGMTDLSLAARSLLEKEWETGLTPPSSVASASDGTKKYLFGISDNRFIETAFIPDRDRATVCLSVQSGCRMGCHFCMTARQGFQGNLSSGDILNQFRSIPEHLSLTNIVYMGMGEPLDNFEEVMKSLEILTSEWGYGWSPSRITVSTIGITDRIRDFLEGTRCHLAVSLHSPFDEERQALMPVQKAHPIKNALEVIRGYDFGRQRRISFEYILFEGLNDTPAHVRELARILNGIRCRINLIRFHAIPGSEYRSPDAKAMEAFRDHLNAKGITATIRASRGEDIGAACGLLSTLEQNKTR
ncbi:MAG: 23S rRNA (adenine(2503)-C(2))-methyltransferase RlmN [Bacteroidales bacterium]|nr:23S rRNA (adenine(2503)-C(2))-methyltransferase RlmN [Bacteroidales bacterium]MDT8373962.1 23S rRNA (adenine(2503)-C(2))-methyltransferase RlmN [Bacteroidales bacterium]